MYIWIFVPIGIVILILICVLVWYFCYRKRNQDHDENFSIIIGGSEVLHTNDYTNTSMSIPDSNPASTDITIDIPDVNYFILL